jgi:hypothetical protein
MNSMNKNLVKVTLVIAGAVLFSLIFWQEKLAVNTLFFDAFIMAALFYLYPNAGQQATVRWLLVGHMLCLAMIVMHNTVLSKIAFTATLLLMVAFAEYTHRSAWFAGGSVILNMLLMVPSFIEPMAHIKSKAIKRSTLSRAIRFAIFPVLLLILFFIIYLLANSVLQEMAGRLGAQIELFFERFFNFFAIDRFLFLLLGLLITGTLLLKSKVDYFSRHEALHRDALQRIKIPMHKRGQQPFYAVIRGIMGRFAHGMLALRNEYTIGIISLVLLNILLLFVNGIDISYLWFHFDYMGDVFLYKMLHEGTELLIVSIVLAMLVLLFFFKGNLNFYKRNKWLKYGAYAWIIQNTILVISVFLRDYYYIARYGLAYKRIGVLFFLLMVLIGLITVFIKIWYKQTNYFLFRVNAWAGITVLVLSTTLHWDEFIASYNLQRKDAVPLDVAFLLTLSDKTLPLLDRNRDVLQKRQDTLQRIPGKQDNNLHGDTCFIAQLQQREMLFVKQQQQLSWLSWNYADTETKSYFMSKGILPVH